MDKQLVTGDEQEPVFSRAVAVAVATAGVGAAVAFGLPLTDAQQTAVIAVVAAVAPLVLAWWARRHVNSPASTAKVLDRR
jgi:hypothetical protein